MAHLTYIHQYFREQHWFNTTFAKQSQNSADISIGDDLINYHPTFVTSNMVKSNMAFKI